MPAFLNQADAITGEIHVSSDGKFGNDTSLDETDAGFDRGTNYT